MKRIALLCASRGRPERFTAMVKSVIDTAADMACLEIYLAIDADDPHFDDYSSNLSNPWVNLRLNSERRTVPALLNWMAATAAEPILMSCADDLIFRTKGWDAKVRAAFDALPDGIGVAVPMDGAEDRKGLRCTHWFCSREWVDLVGYFAPELYGHFYADTHVADIAARCGRLAWMQDVLIEHMHPNARKAARDATYSAKRSGSNKGLSERDRVTYLAHWKERADAAHRILKAHH